MWVKEMCYVFAECLSCISDVVFPTGLYKSYDQYGLYKSYDQYDFPLSDLRAFYLENVR